MEVRRNAEAFICTYDCDECGEKMKFMGTQLLSYPPMYPHECENGHTANLYDAYPIVRHKLVGSTEWK